MGGKIRTWVGDRATSPDREQVLRHSHPNDALASVGGVGVGFPHLRSGTHPKVPQNRSWALGVTQGHPDPAPGQ